MFVRKSNSSAASGPRHHERRPVGARPFHDADSPAVTAAVTARDEQADGEDHADDPWRHAVLPREVPGACEGADRDVQRQAEEDGEHEPCPQ